MNQGLILLLVLVGAGVLYWYYTKHMSSQADPAYCSNLCYPPESGLTEEEQQFADACYQTCLNN